ncbi:MAG: transposase [Oligoflexales bacterium]
MWNLIEITLNILVLFLRLLKPNGYKKILAENVALRQQLLVVSRKYKKAPNLKTSDRLIFSFLAQFLPRNRLRKVAIIVSPSTILRFHRALVKKKYQILFTASNPKKRGPKGFGKDIIDLIIEIKKRNLSFGCPRIAMMVTNATGTRISEHTVRRILRRYFKPNGGGPSWLTFLASQKDSLWSLDFFRVDSIALKSYWVMIVTDQFSREIVGIRTLGKVIQGSRVCHSFNNLISEIGRQPKYLSTDNDPVFNFHLWQINIEMMNIEQVNSIPGVPTSHPFIERCIGSTRREFLDNTLFWSQNDLDAKLKQFQKYFNESRPHYALGGLTPNGKIWKHGNCFQFKNYCNGLFSVPMAG